MGERKKGLEYQEKALEIRKRVLGENHADTAASYNNVGFSYFYLNDYARAYEYLNQAYYIFSRIYGEEHPRTQQTKSDRDFVERYI